MDHRLILYRALLTYDCVSFYRHLETILAINAPPPGSTRQSQSPWLFLDAAHTIFSLAKRRVYTGTVDDSSIGNTGGNIPQGLVSRLEEQPKWAILAEVLEEIERDLYFNPTPRDNSNGTTLIMCREPETCRQIREYLQTMHDKLPTGQGEDEEDQDANVPSAAIMMRRKLRSYLAWKGDFAKMSAMIFAENQKTGGSEGQKRGSESYRGRAPPNKRRRVRGGSSTASGPSRGASGAVQVSNEATHTAQLLAGVKLTDAEQRMKQEVGVDPMENLEDYFELYEMSDLIVVHPYDGDVDEHILEELKPRFVIMYDPDSAFIRRVEVSPAFISLGVNICIDPSSRYIEARTKLETSKYISCIMENLRRNGNISVRYEKRRIRTQS